MLALTLTLTRNGACGRNGAKRTLHGELHKSANKARRGAEATLETLRYAELRTRYAPRSATTRYMKVCASVFLPISQTCPRPHTHDEHSMRVRGARAEAEAPTSQREEHTPTPTTWTGRARRPAA